jgi:hypothetical protein
MAGTRGLEPATSDVTVRPSEISTASFAMAQKGIRFGYRQQTSRFRTPRKPREQEDTRTELSKLGPQPPEVLVELHTRPCEKPRLPQTIINSENVYPSPAFFRQTMRGSARRLRSQCRSQTVKEIVNFFAILPVFELCRDQTVQAPAWASQVETRWRGREAPI